MGRYRVVVCAVLGGCQWAFPYEPPPPPPIREVALGATTSCALADSGELMCWGDNRAGQLGVALPTTDIATPLAVEGSWRTVAVRTTHGCGVTDDRTIACWGDVPAGDGMVHHYDRPVRLEALDALGVEWDAVAVGRAFTCALARDATLWCWGDGNANRNLPLSATPSPIVVAPGWQSVSAGEDHLCAVARDHSGWCWGRGEFGQLGDGASIAQPSPVQVAGEWLTMRAGYAHSCGITMAGTLECWGANSYGALGDGTTVHRSRPVAVLGDRQWKDVAAGGFHSCAIDTSGGGWCWGNNDRGQLGSGDFVTATAPIAIDGDRPVTAIAAGGFHSCLATGAEVRCTGFGGLGQLGDGRGGSQPSPVYLPNADWALPAAAGLQQSCASHGEQLACWGAGDRHRLVVGETSQQTPIDVAPRPLAVAIGDEHTCVIEPIQSTTTTQLACWGFSRNDNIDANGDREVTRTVVTTPGTTGLDAVVASKHTCIHTTSERTLSCWGLNTNSQTAIANLPKVPPPQPTIHGREYDLVAAGGQHTCATMGGFIYCWGDNSSGQLDSIPNATETAVTERMGPIQRPKFAVLAAGGYHSCAIDSDGQLACWGANSRGQLGPTTSNLALLDGSWRAVAAGDSHSCGIKTDGTLWCWGANQFGQLGDATRADRREPVMVEGTDWAGVFAATTHTCALARDGRLACWGANDAGQLGDGSAWRSAWVAVDHSF